MRIPLILAGLLLVLSILIDLYIGFYIKKRSPRGGWWKLYAVSSVVLWLFLLVVLCLPKRSEDTDILPLMWMLWSYLSVYLGKFVFTVFALAGSGIRSMFRFKKGGPAVTWIALGASLWFFAMLWVGVFSTRRSIVIEEVTLESPKIPEAFDGFRIVQLSDLHVGTWGKDPSFLNALVDSVNSLRPDLIVFTGDIVNRRSEELLPFVQALGRLDAPYGVLSVLGNHDYGDYVDWQFQEEKASNHEMLLAMERGMGWDLLNNSRKVLYQGNDSIVVAGVENWGDPPFHTYGILEDAISASMDSVINQNDDNFKILLTHNPEHWNREVADNANFDLTLSGHTHAMQAMLSFGGWKWSPAVYRYPLWGGLYERKNKNGETVRLYVNIGAGEVGMPARLFDANPEITLITLRK